MLLQLLTQYFKLVYDYYFSHLIMRHNSIPLKAFLSNSDILNGNSMYNIFLGRPVLRLGKLLVETYQTFKQITASQGFLVSKQQTALNFRSAVQ